jgi:2'-5' RNA ligase
MIRLFIAIEIPGNIKIYLRGMGGSIPGGKAVAAEQLHLTLKFIGEVESSRLLDIAGALDAINTTGFALQLQGVGSYPPRGAPRVIWAGVKGRESENGLIPLRNSIEKALLIAGIPRQKKKFSPHITLARLHNSPIMAVQNFLAGNSFFESPWFEVNSFTLFSSQLTTKGAIHRVENRYQLR